MQFQRISEQRAYETLKARNQEFWARSLAIPGLYELLELHGHDYRECVFAAACSDGGQTSFGILIGPDRQILEFDLDPDDLAGSTLEQVSPPDPRKRLSAEEARSPRWLAWRYFEELLRSRECKADP